MPCCALGFLMVLLSGLWGPLGYRGSDPGQVQAGQDPSLLHGHCLPESNPGLQHEGRCLLLPCMCHVIDRLKVTLKKSIGIIDKISC